MIINTSNWTWAHYAILILWAVNTVTIGFVHGMERRDSRWNVGWTILKVVTFGALLTFGGFWS